MAARQITNKLYYFPKPNRWQKGIGAELPEAYRKFWREWKNQQPTAVHYIPEEGKYKWDAERGSVREVQNVPLPLRYPKELNEGIWGGETVVQGYQKKGKFKRPVARFWVPRLMKSVVYSEVLDTYIRTIITHRTLDLIHENYGFDHYLLKTPACDLRSELALKIKRKILIALADKTLYPDNPEKQEEVYNKYKEYLTAYTREEIEWYGLNYKEAINKFLQMKRDETKIEPLKINYRLQLIEKLKKAKIEAADLTENESGQSWLAKINPFSKSEKNEK